MELPNTAEGIVPDRFPAVNPVKLAPDTAPNDPDQVPDVIVPTVVKEELVTLEDNVDPVKNPAGAEPSIEIIPVNACAADDLFKAMAVVPTYAVELPNTALGIVPDKLPAVNDVKPEPFPLNDVAVNGPVFAVPATSNL